MVRYIGIGSKNNKKCGVGSVIASISFLTIISLIPSSYPQTILFFDNFDDGDIRNRNFEQ